MTASAPLIQKVALFKLATVSFAEDLVDAELVPVTPAAKTVTTLDGIVHQDIATEAWELRLKMVLDHDSGRPGLAYKLNSDKGTTVAFEFNPHGTGTESASQPKWTGSCKLVPVPAGGPGNEYAIVDVVLPVVGTPVRDATP